jgi:membrane protease YdiL (CAAX protease family)
MNPPVLVEAGCGDAASSVQSLIAIVADAATTLQSIDRTLQYSSIVVLGAMLSFWLVVSRRNPLRNAPHRAHELEADIIVLTVLLFVLASAVFDSAARLFQSAVAAGRSPAFQLVAVQLAGIAICLVVVRRRWAGGAHAFCLARPRGGIFASLALALCGACLSVGLCEIVLKLTIAAIRAVLPNHDFTLHQTIQALRSGLEPPVIVILLWIGAGVLAPIGEELFFRGMLQTFAAGRSRKTWLGIIVASTAFAMVHFTQPETLPALFVLGLILGVVYELTGSLIPPIAIHALFNLKTLAWEACGAYVSA